MINGFTDPLQPIYHTNNRQERLCVEYHGFIKNVTESVVKTMLRNVEEWSEYYPKLPTLDDLSREDLYGEVNLFDPVSFLYILSDGKNSIDDINQHIEMCEVNAFPQLHEKLQFEITLRNLLTQPFIEKVAITKEKFYNVEIAYLESMFDDFIDKIEFIETPNIHAMVQEDYTTYFTNDTNYLLNHIFKLNEKEDLQDKLFVLRNNHTNLLFNKETKHLDTLYQDEIIEINDRKIIGITRMYSLPFEN